MTTFIVCLFTAFAGCIALGAMVATVRRYGPSALRLRDAIRACPQTHGINFAITEIEVRPQGGTVLWPNFSANARARTASGPLRAAA